MVVGNMYFHNAESFKKLWDEVAQETGTAWTVDVELVTLDNWGLNLDDYEWMGLHNRGVNFACTRVKALL